MLADRYASAPFGSVRCSYPEATGTPELRITNPGGGILGGDRLELYATLAPGASARIVTQGASKVYRGPESSQSAVFEVEEDAHLEYLPHHLIPFRESTHRQTTEFWLHSNASMLAWEAFSAGRIARGERFAFDLLSSRTRVFYGKRLLGADGFDLSDGAEHFGGYSYLGSVFAVLPEASRLGQELQEHLQSQSRDRQEPRIAASAPEENLCVIRVLARTAEGLYSSLCRVPELARAVTEAEVDAPQF